MSKPIPELAVCLKHYSKKDFAKDVSSGIIVAIIALPLSIALALASGVSPEEGLYTAIAAGFAVSVFGGSRVQIAGPTAAFATIVAGIVAKNGLTGLATATILAGLMLIAMGLCRMGSMIKFIPATITVGFTAGIAVTIVIGQIKDFLGLTFSTAPIETMDKVKAVADSMDTFNAHALITGCVALAILIFWPKVSEKIPSSLVAVLATALMVKFMELPVNTIGDLYTISSAPPTLHMPDFSFATIEAVLPDAFTIAILAAIESLLSAVVADEMIGTVHNSNMELIGQGVGNTVSALFGGIPATGAIARTAANIKNGGRTPVAGIVHSVVLLLVLILLMPYAALIPMPCIAAILFQVAYNMSGWRMIAKILKSSPKSDILVLVATFFLTVIFNLVIAIIVGMTLSCLLFMRRMADVACFREWTYDEEAENNPKHRYKKVPEHVAVYEFNGAMFFGVTDKLPSIENNEDKKIIIMRMKGVPAIDVTALKDLKLFLHECKMEHIKVIFSHVNSQPMSVFKKSGIYEEAGSDFFKPNIDASLNYAKKLIAEEALENTPSTAA